MTTRTEEIHPHLAELFKKHGMSAADQALVLQTSLLSTGRLIGMIQALEVARGVAGETAEVGVAHGGTSRLIALRNGGRRHWCCDTFVGLVDVGPNDPQFSNGQFNNPLPKVAATLRGLSNVEMVSGYFPQSAPEAMREARFSLVHIDVDTYASIKGCFQFFASRMAPGGVIVLDDVIKPHGCAGAIKAFRELPQIGWKVIARTAPQAVVRFDQ